MIDFLWYTALVIVGWLVVTGLVTLALLAWDRCGRRILRGEHAWRRCAHPQSPAARPDGGIPGRMPIQLREVSQDRGTGRRAVRVLHRISFHLEAGELVLLQGPSGSGKTTLLGVAAGLLTPAEGDVTLAGRSLGTATTG